MKLKKLAELLVEAKAIIACAEPPSEAIATMRNVYTDSPSVPGLRNWSKISVKRNAQELGEEKMRLLAQYVFWRATYDSISIGAAERAIEECIIEGGLQP